MTDTSALHKHLVHRLREPATECFERLRKKLDDLPVDETSDVDTLASFYTVAIYKYVNDLVERPYRKATLESPSLASQWDLYDFGRVDISDVNETCRIPFDLRQLASELLAQESRLGQKQAPWPSNVTTDDIRLALKLTKDVSAQWVATALEQGLIGPHDGRFRVHEKAYVQQPRHQSGRFTPMAEGVGHLKDLVDPEQHLDTTLARSQGRLDAQGRRVAPELDRGLERWPLYSVALIVSIAKTTQAAENLLASPLNAARFAWHLIAELTRDSAEPLEARRQIVTDALRREENHAEPNDSAPDERAVHELEREVRLRIEDAREAVRMNEPPPVTEEEASTLEGGILAWDERFAGYLESFGYTGKKAATAVRRSAAKRQGNPKSLWLLWADPNTSPIGTRFAQVLASVLWTEVVQPRMRNPASLVFPVMDGVTRLHSRTFTSEERNGQQVLRLSDNNTVSLLTSTVPTVQAAALDELLRRGLDLLGSVAGHRVLRWEVFEGHTRAMQGVADARHLRINGGWSALADRLGLRSRQDIQSVRAIVHAQSRCLFMLPGDKQGTLLSFTEDRAVGRRQGEVTITLGDPLLPHYVFGLRSQLRDGSRTTREAQRLVPMVTLPPFVGRPNEHGQQATLSLTLVTEMRARARELVEEGGVRIDLIRFAELARLAALPKRLICPVLERWLRDGDDAAAFLKQTGKDRFTLGDSHGAARAFLEEAGRRERAGIEGGKLSAVSREREIERRQRKSLRE